MGIKLGFGTSKAQPPEVVVCKVRKSFFRQKNQKKAITTTTSITTAIVMTTHDCICKDYSSRWQIINGVVVVQAIKYCNCHQFAKQAAQVAQSRFRFGNEQWQIKEKIK